MYPQSDISLAMIDIDASKGFVDLWVRLGETSKLIGCSLYIQQPVAANLYRKCYTLLLNAAAFCLQPPGMNFDVFPYPLRFLLFSI